MEKQALYISFSNIDFHCTRYSSVWVRNKKLLVDISSFQENDLYLWKFQGHLKSLKHFHHSKDVVYIFTPDKYNFNSN